MLSKVRVFMLTIMLMPLLVFSGCSTFVNTEKQELYIKVFPNDAIIKLFNENKQVISIARGEMHESLIKKKDFSTARKYSVEITASGYESKEFNLLPRASGWYIAGNILSLGLGWMADRSNGAMWVYDDEDLHDVDNLLIRLDKKDLKIRFNNNVPRKKEEQSEVKRLRLCVKPSLK